MVGYLLMSIILGTIGMLWWMVDGTELGIRVARVNLAHPFSKPLCGKHLGRCWPAPRTVTPLLITTYGNSIFL